MKSTESVERAATSCGYGTAKTSAYRPARVATHADIDAAVSTMTTAFIHDPLWGPAFPDASRRAEQAAAMWRLHVTYALRYS
ncbi:hypothetical protein ACFYXC_12615 [Streptomyces sp. NPDC002701]|uniref:hypothetical protein n=1 Tax=Streptomyces sp. NPDC002701 TaxID=3364661 RepID=UPI00367BCB50